MIVDYRRSLLGAVDRRAPHRLHLEREALTAAVTEPGGSLQRRLPGPDVTPEQLRDRSWWTGPEVFVLVDDYDLVAARRGQPAARRWSTCSPRPSDVGLHLVVARRTGGRRAGDVRAGARPPARARVARAWSGAAAATRACCVGTARPGPQPPGRGWLVGRRHGETPRAGRVAGPRRPDPVRRRTPAPGPPADRRECARRSRSTSASTASRRPSTTGARSPSCDLELAAVFAPDDGEALLTGAEARRRAAADPSRFEPSPRRYV